MESLKARVLGRRRLPALIRRFCVGRGIEIGAGNNPYCSRANTVFLDKSATNAQATGDADIIADAASVPVADHSFDFVFSSHCLEHHQNTLLVLTEWRRILKPGGTLFLVLPHADRSLDRHRTRTTLAHHIRDLETLSQAPDRSHFEEMERGWRQLADLAHWEALHRRYWDADFWDCEFRLTNDGLHFHVWTQTEMIEILLYLGMQIVFVDESIADRPDSFVVIASRTNT